MHSFRVSWSRWRADLLTAAFTAAVVVLLGAPAGIVWSAVAPHAHVTVNAAGANVVDGATEVFIAGDGWFVGVTLLIGIVSGALAWLAGRRSSSFVLVGLFLGGLLASYIASRVGLRIGRDALRAAVSSGRPGTFVANVALQATVAVLIWPLAAVVTFGTLVLSRAGDVD